ncbi:MAG TPA: PEGA domain-containing protein, partial [Vicinamibacterales bacterium]|nr:PEGA domain-containing protein [Vicinamibacterales bacterium]
RGTTPLLLRNLPPGTYALRVVRAGYRPQTARVVLPAQAAERDVLFRLEEIPRPRPAGVTTGSLYIDSRPRGARVLVDDRFVGATPVQVAALPEGPHRVRLELDGHRIWTTTANVVAGQVVRVSGSLEPVVVR